MSENEGATAPEPQDPPERWAGRQYVAELIRELEAVSSDLLRGRNRFPAKLELSHAPAQFRSIIAIAQRALANWSKVRHDVAEEIEQSLMQLLEIVAEIEARPLAGEDEMAPDSRRVSNEIKGRLEEIQAFFGQSVEPLVEDPGPQEGEPDELETENLRRTRAELNRSKKEMTELEAAVAQINAELDSRKDALEATRAESGAQGTQNLAEEYDDQANEHERQWKYWGGGLVAATLTALIGGYLVLKVNQPSDDASTAQLVSHVAVDLLVIGILIYVVRVTSLQFSVHRHLAAVARNKAAALATFSRIVSSGSSSETRDRLAEVLAHCVFISSDTGFLDAAGDQVTLPERLAGSVVNGARSATSTSVTS